MTRWLCIAFALLVAACVGASTSSNAPVAPTYTSGSRIPPVAQTKARGMKTYNIKGVQYYPRDDLGYRYKGYASWYGPKFHGKLTANGERFNQWALTAAHKTLPLGSFAKVTNLANGRSQVVLINDRGPFVRGRIIDLSRRAAEILDVVKKGTAPVIVERTDRYGRPLVQRAPARKTVAPARVQQVRQPPTVPTQPARSNVVSRPAGPLTVQVGSFSDFANARRLQQGLADVGPVAINQITLSDGAIRYRVQIGPYADPIAAEQALSAVHAKGHRNATLKNLTPVLTPSS